MFKRLLKSKKAQNTAEYAILISLVVAGIIAMQTYAQRALQARVRDASQHLKTQTSALGNTAQYEPYYLTTAYNVETDQNEIQRLNTNLVRDEIDTTVTRKAGGSQESSYNAATFGLGVNGI